MREGSHLSTYLSAFGIFFDNIYPNRWSFPLDTSGKEPTCHAGDIRDSSLIAGSGRSLEEGMAAHSSILAWRVPWTEEPGGLVHEVAESHTAEAT